MKLTASTLHLFCSLNNLTKIIDSIIIVDFILIIILSSSSQAFAFSRKSEIKHLHSRY